MARNESIPLFDHGDTLTVTATQAMAGKRFAAVPASGDARDAGAFGAGRIRAAYPAAGGGRVIGVTCYDVAADAGVTIHHATTIVAPVTAGAAITAGQLVTSDDEGRAVPHTGTGVVLGIALDSVASGADVFVDRTIRG